MEPTWIIATTFGAFALFLLLGQRISSLLILSGLLGIFLIGGWDLASSFLSNDPYLRVASYSLTPVPLFVLMAQFVLRARLVNDLYHLIYTLSRGSAALLGVLTVILGGLLGAVSGSGTATAAAMGQVAVPELVKRGYGDYLAGAIAASAGSLSAIVPPSIILIIYGAITQTSISTLFIAAILPATLMVLIYAAYATWLLVKSLRLAKTGTAPQQTLAEDTTDETPPGWGRYLIAILSCGTIALIIFGGIYFGIFTPTEAAAVGCVVSFLTALVLGAVDRQFMVKSARESIDITVMVLLIMVGAQIFGRFLSLSRIPHNLVSAVSGLGDMPFLLLAIILALCFLLFMFIEGSAVIVMIVPVVLPLIIDIGYDPIWFGVILCVLCAGGLLTPPVGLSVYAVAGVTGLRIDRLFRHSTMFAFLVLLLVGALMILFPGMVTFLPEQMK